MTTSEHMSAIASLPRTGKTGSRGHRKINKPTLCDCGNLATCTFANAPACDRCRTIETAMRYDDTRRAAPLLVRVVEPYRVALPIN